MIQKITTLFISLIILVSAANAQQERQPGGSISGRVFDFNDRVPIEYANVIVFKSADSTQVTGTISDKEGKFSVAGILPGKYYVDVQFIGYRKKRVSNITISSSKKNVSLGDIFIKIAAINLQNVEVKGDRSPVTYQIDKKILDVNKLPTTISGSAADVLENVPSVTVDIDGNVSLRGSTSFTVLIDGRPSVLDAQDALQQIPASSIETIEIITNPSAKYDPEGNAGIVNIKLKKEKNNGIGGIANVNAGLNNKFGGDFLFEHKQNDFSYNFGMNYSKRFFPGDRLDSKWFDLGNEISYLNSSGGSERGRTSFGMRGGVSYNFSDNDLLTLGGRYGSRDGLRNSTSNYNQWSDVNPDNVFYLSRNESSRTGNYFAANVNYLRKFAGKGHELSAEFFVSHRNSDESSTSSDINSAVQFDGKKTTESGPSTEFRQKIDYTLPINEGSKFEAGSQGEMELSDESNGLYTFNPSANSYDFQSLYSHTIKSNISELAIYSIYSAEWNNLGIQGGLRTEYTYRTIKLMDNNENFSMDRWDFFPSIHASYKFAEGTQAMASYTRRIDRPHGWNLEPFLTWMDANNVRMGNPSLKPELIDSYEFGFQTFVGNVTFSNDFYYRINNNKIEGVRSVYAENITLNTFQNVGTDYSLGMEFMFTADPLPVWNLNLMGNVYDYRIKGTLYDAPFEQKSFNWSTRIGNGFKFASSTQLQVDVRYNSPSVSSQGRSEGYFRTDAAVKHDLIPKVLSLTLQVRDIFGTSKHEFTSHGPDFYSYSMYTHESPMVMLHVRYNFNNYEDQRRDENRGGEDNGFNSGEDI